MRCFVDASGNIQRWILATMIRRLNKLNWGQLATGIFLMWRAVDLQGRRTTLNLGDLVSILGYMWAE